MGLPLGDGVVSALDKIVMLAACDDAQVSSLTNSSKRPIEKHCRSKAQVCPPSDLPAIVHKKGSQQVGFASGVESGLTLACVQDLDGVSESSSATPGTKKSPRAPRIPRPA